MTEEIFNDKKNMKCWRTAKARLREYARLQSEFYSLDYEQTYNDLLKGAGL